MKQFKLAALGVALLGSTAITAHAQEVQLIMCGGEISPADQTVIEKVRSRSQRRNR